MTRNRLGLDRIDVFLHVGITIALGAAIISEARGSFEDMVAAFGLTCAASLALFGLRRWWVLRRLPREPASDERIEEFELRLGELDALKSRLFELEERLDFTERLLTQQREPERLPEGRR